MRRTEPTGRESGLALLVLLGVLVFLLFPLLKGSSIQILRASRNVPGDEIDLYFPLFDYFSSALRQGQWALWCPLIFSGFPLLASQNGCFYPLNVLAACLLPSLWGYNLAVFTGFVIGGVNMHLLGRRLGLDPWSAAYSGILFAGTGFMVGHLAQQNIIKAAGWLPLLLAAVIDLLGPRWRRGVLIGGCALGMQLLAASPQVSYYSLLALLLAMAALVLTGRSGWFGERTALAGWRLIVCCAGLVLIGLGLGAVQILPMWEASSLSTYGTVDTLPKAIAMSYSMTRFVPLFFRGSHPIAPEFEIYIGILPFLLAVIGLLASWARPAWRRIALALTCITLFSLLGISIGIPLFWRVIPGFSLFRFPVRLFLLIHFALTLWAGIGLCRVGEILRARSPRASWAAILVAVLVSVAESKAYISDRWLDVPDDALGAPSAVVSRVRGSIGEGRLYPCHPYFTGLGQFAPPGIMEQLRLYLWPNANLLYGVPSILGTEALEPRHFRELENELWRSRGRVEGGSFGPDERWLRALALEGVTVVTSFWRIEAPRLTLIDRIPMPSIQREVNIYSVPDAVPPERIVHAALARKGSSYRYRLMIEDGFDPMTTTSLEEVPGPLAPAAGPEGISRGDRSPNRMEWEVLLSSPGVFVINSAFHPGWRAWVDGEKRPVLQADSRSLGVYLPAGRHRVALGFLPDSFCFGLALTAVSSLAVLALAVAPSLKKRREIKQGRTDFSRSTAGAR